MAISKEFRKTVLVTESLSTKAAQDVLASQTRAFGNKAAKLQLQMATSAFVQAKQRLDAAEALKIDSKSLLNKPNLLRVSWIFPSLRGADFV